MSNNLRAIKQLRVVAILAAVVGVCSLLSFLIAHGRKTETVQTNTVRNAVLAFKTDLDAGHLESAYGVMSRNYTNRYGFAMFRWRASEYRKKLNEVSTNDHVDVSRGQASVYVGKDVGFAIDLVFEGVWHIDSLDRLWQNEH